MAGVAGIAEIAITFDNEVSTKKEILARLTELACPGRTKNLEDLEGNSFQRFEQTDLEARKERAHRALAAVDCSRGF
jgi:hypothetical protein